MAFYVLLLKESETDGCAVYRFGPREGKLGRLSLDKSSGAVDELEPVPIENPRAFFMRAAVKVRQHWREQVFPNQSSWQS